MSRDEGVCIIGMGYIGLPTADLLPIVAVKFWVSI